MKIYKYKPTIPFWWRLQSVLATLFWVFLGFILMSMILHGHPTQRIQASYYNSGIITANGEFFDPNLLTCASWYYPFGTYLKVTNVANNKSVIVRVNDRGPNMNIVSTRGVLIDLTQKASEFINGGKAATLTVTIERVTRK